MSAVVMIMKFVGVVCACALVVSIDAIANNGKQPLILFFTDPTTKVQSQLAMRDANGDGCWDQLLSRSANGAEVLHLVFDGYCNASFNATLQVRLIDGSLESDSFVIALYDATVKQTLGLLLKDAGTNHVAYIPSIQQNVNRKNIATAKSIGIQMSVSGESAVIAVPDDMAASVMLVQPNGESTALFTGELNSGNTTFSLPAAIVAGTYVLSVETEIGTQSVAFTLQR